MMRLKPTCRTSPKLAPKTHAAYKLTLDLFQQSCSKIFVHQVSKQDLQAFDSFLLKQGHEDRTRANRIQHVITFLRNKEGRRAGPPVTDVSIRIKYVEQPVEAYTRQELEDLFRATAINFMNVFMAWFLRPVVRSFECSINSLRDAWSWFP